MGILDVILGRDAQGTPSKVNMALIALLLWRWYQSRQSAGGAQAEPAPAPRGGGGSMPRSAPTSWPAAPPTTAAPWPRRRRRRGRASDGDSRRFPGLPRGAPSSSTRPCLPAGFRRRPGRPLQVGAGWAGLPPGPRPRARRPAAAARGGGPPPDSSRVRAAARPTSRARGGSLGRRFAWRGGPRRAALARRGRVSPAVRGSLPGRGRRVRPTRARLLGPLARSGRVRAVPLSLSLPARPGAARRPGRRGSRAAPRGLPRPARAPWAMLVRLSFLSVPRVSRACPRARRRARACPVLLHTRFSALSGCCRPSMARARTCRPTALRLPVASFTPPSCRRRSSSLLLLEI